MDALVEDLVKRTKPIAASVQGQNFAYRLTKQQGRSYSVFGRTRRSAANVQSVLQGRND